MKIFSLLDRSDFIISYDIVDYQRWDSGYYFKIKANLCNESNLFIREYVDELERNYSYHWQNKKSELIIRWDNAPYHKNIISYPHHKHKKGKVFESKEVTIEDVLKYIRKELKIK